MAKIEMDVSEYEAMKENKRLLEQSLDRERNLKDQIDKLHDEKVQALEDAQKKVVKIIRKEIREHKIAIKPYDQIIENLKGWWVQTYNDQKIPGYKMSENERDRKLRTLLNYLFDTVESETYDDGIEEITTHGLDQVKQEIKEEYEANMTEEIKAKINEAEHSLNQMAELRNALDERINENSRLLDLNDSYVEKAKLMEDQKTILKGFIVKSYQELELIDQKINKKFHVFNAPARIKAIQKEMNEALDNIKEFLDGIENDIY